MAKSLIKFVIPTIYRILPGFLNFLIITKIAHYLGVEKYGIFSTVLATVMFLTNVILGPFKLSIVLVYPYVKDTYKRESYIQSIFSLFVFTLFIAGVGLILAIGGLLRMSYLSILVMFIGLGFSTTFLEFFRADLKFHLFGLFAVIQSILLILGLILLGKLHIQKSLYLVAYIYGGSYILTTFSMIIYMKIPWTFKISLKDIKVSFSKGAWLTLGNIVTDLYMLSFRYIFLYTGDATILSLFSYNLDIVKRSVGIGVNLVSFVTVPHALNADSKGDKRLFLLKLRMGIFLSLLVVTLAVLFLKLFGERLGIISKELFNFNTYLIISLGILFHRLGKLIFIPIFRRDNKLHLFVKYYLKILPFFVIISLIFVNFLKDKILILFFMGFLVWFVFTILFEIKNSNKTSYYVNMTNEKNKNM